MIRTRNRLSEGALLLALMCSASPGQLAQAQQSSLPARPNGPVQRRLAVTVDDLPGAEAGTDHAAGDIRELRKINHAIPAILHAHHAPAIGFVNEWKLEVSGERDARAALLQMWLDAGMTLGNHTYLHDDLQTTPLAQFEDEVIRGEVVTRALLTAAGQQMRYFRHPFLNTGPSAEVKAAFETFLSQRGYRIAPVTVEDADYEFNDIYGEALAKKDKKLAAQVEAAYLAYVDTVFDFFEDESRKMFGREIPQVFLIHDNEINTKGLDALLTKLEKRGYTFVSLDDALADPAYATSDNFVGPMGITWFDRWKVALGQKPDYQHNPDPPEWVEKMFNEIRKAHAK